MILVDTSGWIEFLRDGDEVVVDAVRSGIRAGELVVTDPVYLELLSGARPRQVDAVTRLLGEQHYQSVAPRLDWVDAAEIYRGCRSRGLTIRSQVDCLIAAVAIRLGVPLVHFDRGFDAIARHTNLQLI